MATKSFFANKIQEESMNIEYEIKGITLNRDDMLDIKKFYEARLTAEYLLENYKVTEETAIELGYEVRRMMDKYCCSETMAIYDVISDREIEKITFFSSAEEQKAVFIADGLSEENAQRAIDAGCKIYTSEEMYAMARLTNDRGLQSDLDIMRKTKITLPDWIYLKYDNKDCFICYENEQDIDFEKLRNKNQVQDMTLDQGFEMTM